MEEVADRIYRLGSDIVNWYLIEDGGRFTVLDAGLPKQYDQLPAALGELGAVLSDVEAVALTHAHADHLGSSARIKEQSRAAVHVHHQDADLARGEAERKNERGYARDLLNPYAWRSTFLLISGGALKPPPVAELSTFEHGDVLDLPGAPRVIHTPGHTIGSCALEVASRSVLFTGDSLVMLNVTTGARGPRIKPGSFNENSDQALDSLGELEGSGAGLILAGHGEPWLGVVADAVAEARRVGPS
jgi:glyoxylase-like metal-dependent hydrolase (beta-lactamase superfamily II)